MKTKISNNSFNENNYNITVKNKEVNVDNFDSIIKKAEKMNKMFESDSKDKMYIILTILVDKMNDKEKSNLLKKIIMDFYLTKGKMSNPYYVLLFRYFEPLLIYKFRDLEVGKSNKEIAACMFISENTVKFHLKNIFSELNISNRSQAIKVAREQNLTN